VWIARANLLRRDVVPDQLGVDATLAHTSRNQLCVLPTEIQDQYRALLGSTLRQRHDATDGNSALPS